LYQTQNLKRVYFSGYIPVNAYDQRLPALTRPPLVRENRLYQSDWLMRFYRFKAEEILSEEHPFLDPDVDPKLGYALRNLHLFPVDINKADYEMILRIPGVGVQSALRIIQARSHRKLTLSHLKKIGVVLKRAKYFIKSNELPAGMKSDLPADNLKRLLLSDTAAKRRKSMDTQLHLFDFNQPALPANLLRH
jgi:predicted DNA-binding helix-hairpin-helix protein